MTAAEMTALAQRYQSLTAPGCVDYLAFEKDLKDLSAAEELAKSGMNTNEVSELDNLGAFIKQFTCIATVCNTLLLLFRCKYCTLIVMCSLHTCN